jgi:membrane protease YdiL (CAAX protease family)
MWRPSRTDRPAWPFFALTYGLSWLFWIPAALMGQDVTTLSVTLLMALGGIGPMVSGVVLTYLKQDRAAQRDYWRRVIQFNRIGPGWYTVIGLTVPALTTLAVLLDRLVGGQGAQLEAAQRFLSRPLAILPFAIFTLIFGPIPEELGWRGYALDRLQARWSALASSLILGLAWTLWHLPLFFIAGTYQHQLGLGSPSFWIFMLDKVPQSILMTWLYNHNQRSTLSAVLFHFTINFTGELFALTARAERYQVLLWVVAAIAVTLIWGPKTLTRQREGLARTAA